MPDREKNIRAFIAGLILYAAFLAALIFSLGPRIKANFIDGEYISALRTYKDIMLEGEQESFNIALFSMDGIVMAEKTVKKGFSDDEHLLLEALLGKNSRENIGKGLISYIADGTKLLGLSITEDVAYVELSEEFLNSADITKAKQQIEETLRASYGDLRVAVIVDDEII